MSTFLTGATDAPQLFAGRNYIYSGIAIVFTP